MYHISMQWSGGRRKPHFTEISNNVSQLQSIHGKMVNLAGSYPVHPFVSFSAEPQHELAAVSPLQEQNVERRQVDTVEQHVRGQPIEISQSTGIELVLQGQTRFLRNVPRCAGKGSRRVILDERLVFASVIIHRRLSPASHRQNSGFPSCFQPLPWRKYSASSYRQPPHPVF